MSIDRTRESRGNVAYDYSVMSWGSTASSSWTMIFVLSQHGYPVVMMHKASHRPRVGNLPLLFEARKIDYHMNVGIAEVGVAEVAEVGVGAQLQWEPKQFAPPMVQVRNLEEMSYRLICSYTGRDSLQIHAAAAAVDAYWSHSCYG